MICLNKVSSLSLISLQSSLEAVAQALVPKKVRAVASAIFQKIADFFSAIGVQWTALLVAFRFKVVCWKSMAIILIGGTFQLIKEKQTDKQKALFKWVKENKPYFATPSFCDNISKEEAKKAVMPDHLLSIVNFLVKIALTDKREIEKITKSLANNPEELPEIKGLGSFPPNSPLKELVKEMLICLVTSYEYFQFCFDKEQREKAKKPPETSNSFPVGQAIKGLFDEFEKDIIKSIEEFDGNASFGKMMILIEYLITHPNHCIVSFSKEEAARQKNKVICRQIFSEFKGIFQAATKLCRDTLKPETLNNVSTLTAMDYVSIQKDKFNDEWNQSELLKCAPNSEVILCKPSQRKSHLTQQEIASFLSSSPERYQGKVFYLLHNSLLLHLDEKRKVYELYDNSIGCFSYKTKEQLITTCLNFCDLFYANRIAFITHLSDWKK